MLIGLGEAMTAIDFEFTRSQITDEKKVSAQYIEN